MHIGLQSDSIKDLEDQVRSDNLDEGCEDQEFWYRENSPILEDEPCLDKARVQNVSRDSSSPDLPDTSKMSTSRRQRLLSLEEKNPAKRAKLEGSSSQKDSMSVSLSIPSLSQLDGSKSEHVQKRAFESCSQNTSSQQKRENISKLLLKSDLDKADHTQEDKASKGLNSVSLSDSSLPQQIDNLEVESRNLEDSDNSEGRKQVSKLSCGNPKSFFVSQMISANEVQQIGPEDSGKRLKGALKDIDEDFHGVQELETLCSRSQNFEDQAVQTSVMTKIPSCKSFKNGSQIMQFSEVGLEEEGEHLLAAPPRRTLHSNGGKSILAKKSGEISGSKTRSHTDGFALPQKPSTRSGKQVQSQKLGLQNCEIHSLGEKDEEVELGRTLQKDAIQALEQKVPNSTLVNEEDEKMQPSNSRDPSIRQLNLPEFDKGFQENIMAQNKHRFQGLKIFDLSHGKKHKPPRKT